MGSQIAALFTFVGYRVVVVDIVPPSNFGQTLARWQRLLARNDKMAGLKTAAAGTCTLTTSLAALSHCTLIIECIAENLESKISLFKQVESLATPDAALATNTSSLSVGGMAAALSHPHRLIGLHFFNPVHAIPLVEMCVPPDTPPPLVAGTTALLESAGRMVIALPDTPGFVVNRLLFLMIATAIRMTDEDKIPPESVDMAMKTGTHMPMGPLELADLIGLDICLTILRNLHERTGNASYIPPRRLEELVGAGHLGKKSGRGFYSKGG
jgi:3-hydroxybutyryl-CoA dehydrogenase